MDWVTQGDGLHTHSIHTISLVPGTPSLVAYATQDNDAWWRKADGNWDHSNLLGDANWTVTNGVTLRRFSPAAQRVLSY